MAIDFSLSCEKWMIAFWFLHFQSASQQYEANFRETMGIVGSKGLDDQKITRMLGAQCLWDATMAHSITKALYRSNLVVHVTGHFHVKQNLGIPEHLAHYRYVYL